MSGFSWPGGGGASLVAAQISAQSTGQTITSTVAAVEFDTSDHDDDGLVDLVNNGILTKSSGAYLIGLGIRVQDPGDQQIFIARILIDGQSVQEERVRAFSSVNDPGLNFSIVSGIIDQKLISADARIATGSGDLFSSYLYAIKLN